MSGKLIEARIEIDALKEKVRADLYVNLREQSEMFKNLSFTEGKMDLTNLIDSYMSVICDTLLEELGSYIAHRKIVRVHFLEYLILEQFYPNYFKPNFISINSFKGTDYEANVDLTFTPDTYSGHRLKYLDEFCEEVRLQVNKITQELDNCKDTGYTLLPELMDFYKTFVVEYLLLGTKEKEWSVSGYSAEDLANAWVQLVATDEVDVDNHSEYGVCKVRVQGV